MAILGHLATSDKGTTNGTVSGVDDSVTGWDRRAQLLLSSRRKRVQFANHRGQVCASSSGRYGGTTSRSETQLRSLQAASEVERAELAARQATEQTKRHVKETRKALEDAERALSQAKVESKRRKKR